MRTILAPVKHGARDHDYCDLKSAMQTDKVSPTNIHLIYTIMTPKLVELMM